MFCTCGVFHHEYQNIGLALLQYQGILANLPGALSVSLERSSVAISSYQPDNDLIAFIERYRSGPFRPNPHVYESITHDQPDIVFGIDLRTWAGEGGWNAVRANEEQKEYEKQDIVPNVVTDLLAGLTEAYKKLANDAGELAIFVVIVFSMRIMSF